MKRRQLALLLPLFAMVVALAGQTVYARDGSDDTSATSTTSSGSGSSGSGSTNTAETDEQESAHIESEAEGATEHRLSESTTESQTKAEAARKRGREEVTKAKEAHKTKTAEERKIACEPRKQGLQTKVDKLNANAAAHLTRIDGVFAKAKAYQSTKAIQLSNYDELVAAATAAQGKATASVQAPRNLKPSVDCNKDTVAADVATFKAAAEQARNDLKAYKQAVRAIVTALVATQETENGQ